jgi:hypothetical protein
MSYRSYSYKPNPNPTERDSKRANRKNETSLNAQNPDDPFWNFWEDDD